MIYESTSQDMIFSLLFLILHSSRDKLMFVGPSHYVDILSHCMNSDASKTKKKAAVEDEGEKKADTKF